MKNDDLERAIAAFVVSNIPEEAREQVYRRLLSLARANGWRSPGDIDGRLLCSRSRLETKSYFARERRNRLVPLLDSDFPRWNPATDSVLAKEFMTVVNEYIDALKPKKRLALCARLQLRAVPPVPVLARLWGRTPQALYLSVAKALAGLQQHLKTRGYEHGID